MFKSSDTGFSMKFENGFEVSVQYGTTSYCSVRTSPNSPVTTAEIAVFREGFSSVIFGDGIQMSNCSYNGGWCSPEVVAAVIATVSQYRKETRHDYCRTNVFEVIATAIGSTAKN